MALTSRGDGTGSAFLVNSDWWNDYYKLLTGTMNDQLVFLKYTGASGTATLRVQGSASSAPLQLLNASASQIFKVDINGNMVVVGSSSLDNAAVKTDGQGTFNGKAANNPSAPSGTLASSTSMGIGAYKYKVTFTTALGESGLGSQLSITTTSGNQKVNLTAIATGGNGVTGRNVYRTAAGGSAFFLLTSIADNTTTTFADTTADGSLGAAAPTHPSLGGDIWRNASNVVVAEVFADGAIYFDTGALTSDGAGSLTLVGITSSGTIAGTVGTFSSTLGVTGVASFGNTLISTAGTLILSSRQSSSAVGIELDSWSGSAKIKVLSIGGQFNSALSWFDTSGNVNAPGFIGTVAGVGIPVTRNNVAGSTPIYTGGTTPTTPPTGSIWIEA